MMSQLPREYRDMVPSTSWRGGPVPAWVWRSNPRAQSEATASTHLTPAVSAPHRSGIADSQGQGRSANSRPMIGESESPAEQSALRVDIRRKQ